MEHVAWSPGPYFHRRWKAVPCLLREFLEEHFEEAIGIRWRMMNMPEVVPVHGRLLHFTVCVLRCRRRNALARIQRQDADLDRRIAFSGTRKS